MTVCSHVKVFFFLFLSLLLLGCCPAQGMSDNPTPPQKNEVAAAPVPEATAATATASVDAPAAPAANLDSQRAPRGAGKKAAKAPKTAAEIDLDFRKELISGVATVLEGDFCPQKMVLVVRTDLPMSTGKKLAQASHAAVGAVTRAMGLDSDDEGDDSVYGTGARGEGECSDDDFPERLMESDGDEDEDEDSASKGEGEGKCKADDSNNKDAAAAASAGTGAADATCPAAAAAAGPGAKPAATGDAKPEAETKPAEPPLSAADAALRDSLAGRLTAEDRKMFVDHWRRTGAKKIAVKGQWADVLKAAKQAKKWGVTYYLVYDAGHTQLDPGTATVLAVGPAPEKIVNLLTGHLGLF